MEVYMQKEHIKVLLAVTPQTNISEIEVQLEHTLGLDCRLFLCADLQNCLKYIQEDKHRFDIILLDLTLINAPESEKFLYEIQQAAPHVPVIVFLREEDSSLALFMAHEGASILKNPRQFQLEPNRLRDLIEYAWIAHRKTQASSERHAAELEAEKDISRQALKEEKAAGAERLREKDQIISWMSGEYSSGKDKPAGR
jgi:DNA-binding NtrC family response regulator